MDDSRSQHLGDFQLGEKLGEGGSAEVFRASNDVLGWTGALKRWRAPLTEDQRRKFLDECRLHWRLSDHPNIVRLYWADASPGEPAWLATELCETSLAARLREGHRPQPAEAWRLAADILAGLSAIHAERHLHRDVKPANVLLQGGRALLCDLGIAMAADGFTQDGAAGTAYFLAPELARGGRPTYRSDVYSAAVTIRQLFGDTGPPALDGLLRRATSSDPGDRPADAAAFAAMLALAAAPADSSRTERTARTPTMGAADHATARRRRRRWPVIAAAVGTFGLLAAVAAVTRLGGAWDHSVATPATSITASIGAPSASATAEERLSPSPSAQTASADPSPEVIVSPTVASSPVASAAPARPCGNRPPAGTVIAVTQQLLTTQPDAARLTRSGGTVRLDFQDRYTWAGLFLKLPAGTCSYRFDLEARIVEPVRTMQNAEGWGFGIGPCNLWTSGGPFGYSLQNAFYRAGTADQPNSGTFRNPDVNDGRVVNVPADYGWHRWSFLVQDNGVTVTREFGVAVTSGAVAGESGLPGNCGGAGIFLRVFNGAAEFRELAVTAL
ncbi:protein kinase domain-containing protein [Dactylosporangium sp. CA-092794]|uniref:serine/threonine-protein kinase n=1 Tax=Dactylosporangium sp. CA-092794 TaxID=3239929 RepID=UPI003D8A6247